MEEFILDDVLERGNWGSALTCGQQIVGSSLEESTQQKMKKETETHKSSSREKSHGRAGNRVSAVCQSVAEV